MSDLQLPTKNAALAPSIGSAVMLGAGVALGGAVIVGVFFGLTNLQSAYVSVLLGWLVGLVINRAGRDMPLAAAAAILALAGAAAGSLIGVTIGVVRIDHVPLSIVLSNMSHVISAVPHVIGWFGVLCWALAAVVGFATVRSRGRRSSAMRRPVGSQGTMPPMPSLPGTHGLDIQPMRDVTGPDAPAEPGQS